jgi:transposase-like protein
MQEAYVQGISTRLVDDLVQAMGMTGSEAKSPVENQRARSCARQSAA